MCGRICGQPTRAAARGKHRGSSHVAQDIRLGRFFVVVGLLSLIVLVLAACSAEPTPTPTPQPAAPDATPDPCAGATSGEDWLSRDYWTNADAAQVQLDLDCGADAVAANDNGWTPLHYSTSYNNAADVTGALVDAGADIEAKDPKYGFTPLHLASYYTSNPDLIRVLVDAGANLQAQDKEGQSPLHHAAANNKTASVTEALLDAGADTAAQDAGGRTPLDTAEGRGNPVAAELLQEAAGSS